ncbi:uncharacterized protein N7515_003793 [Penicillium bovifimosum]|uniref:Uncharacterized protein n=1 Tax=Penicillium bovifimosum TaxID=126998 RepID=A0A9W9L6J6_9EURO|nr:uncharacterized protein N7515_003793 [Penicillium bovifimosum]KAJ5138945.1 hypothetical protein N7515_003793 [Penicillium bovifimosum]
MFSRQSPSPDRAPKPNKELIKIKPPPGIPGPVVVFIARADNPNDHGYPNAKLTSAQMHEHLRALLVITAAEHRERFGVLGTRPPKMQTIVQPANKCIAPLSSVVRNLAAALEEARQNQIRCIFVLRGWDALTTETTTIAQLCDDFQDVCFFLHVYAHRGNPLDFYQVNAHMVNAYLKGVVSLTDEVVVRDHSTALFIRILEALPALRPGFGPSVSGQEKAALSRYDNRFGVRGGQLK